MHKYMYAYMELLNSSISRLKCDFRALTEIYLGSVLIYSDIIDLDKCCLFPPNKTLEIHMYATVFCSYNLALDNATILSIEQILSQSLVYLYLLSKVALYVVILICNIVIPLAKCA